MEKRVTLNSDLKRERENVEFSAHEMTCFLFGGQDKVKRKHYIENLVLADPEFKAVPEYFLPQVEAYRELMRISVHIKRKLKQLDITDPDDVRTFTRVALMGGSHPLSLHDIAFDPPIRLQGTEEQKKKWIPLMDSFEVVGSYCQTELGHGSNVRGVETTAIYDPKTQQFTLNTPSISATKWWPGNLGNTCNHALVIAQTYTQGKNVGVQAFIVPIRDLDTHKPLPGITVGSINPVIGGISSDNGFLQMNNVRIPRENMLMKFSEIKPDGTYVKPPNARALYSGMMSIRAGLPAVAAEIVSQAATIATRYSLVRHQSELKPGSPEPQILEYQAQRHKIFPAIATAYCFRFLGNWLQERFEEFKQEMMQSKFDNMLSLHASSSCLKAYTLATASVMAETCRLACGGHGYSKASGMSRLFDGASGSLTAEGEATVLLLQTSRYLMKAAMDAAQGKKLGTAVSYLTENHGNRFTYTDKLDLHALVTAFKHRATSCVKRAAERLQKLMAGGAAMHDAFNQTGVYLVQAAEAHAEVLIMNAVVSKLNAAGAMRRWLEPLGAVYGIYRILASYGQFIEDGWMTVADIDRLRETLYQLYDQLRPNAIAYVDAFDYRDRVLQSVLGRYDGNVYEEMYKWAKSAPLNDTQVHESFNKYVKPFRESMKSNL